MRFSKSVLLFVESTLSRLEKLEDNEKRGENTFAESRCCSDLWCEKTEEKSISRLFMFDREYYRLI
jgi:hypothetical protein